jgi:hypothetical protein
MRIGKEGVEYFSYSACPKCKCQVVIPIADVMVLMIHSRKFYGVAEMTSRVDWANTDEHWEEDIWQG